MPQSQNAVIMQTQGYLNTAGFNCGTPDGDWGPKSVSAMAALKASTIDTSKALGVNKLAWGMKFQQDAIQKLAQVVAGLGLAPVMVQDFMACMAWETGESFSPSQASPVSSATGLIQFMRATAIGMGTTTDALAKMSVVQQLDYVAQYFKPYKGRLNNTGDVYMSIIWPAGIGKDDSYVMWKQGDPAFAPNSGLDINQDGIITRLECLHKVNNKLAKGFQAQYVIAL